MRMIPYTGHVHFMDDDRLRQWDIKIEGGKEDGTIYPALMVNFLVPEGANEDEIADLMWAHPAIKALEAMYPDLSVGGGAEPLFRAKAVGAKPVE